MLWDVKKEIQKLWITVQDIRLVLTEEACTHRIVKKNCIKHYVKTLCIKHHYNNTTFKKVYLYNERQNLSRYFLVDR